MNPPAWGEALLRIFLKPEVCVAVSGDLLEQYRDSALSDAWYIRQVLAIVLRKTFPWAALFAGAYVARSALDMLEPTTDFHTRSLVSSVVAAGLLAAAGFWIAWRSGSFFAGVVAGLAMTTVSWVLSVAGNAVLLAIWHDTGTLAAIAGSGGLGEMFGLPVMLIAPGVVISGVAGVVGAGVKRVAG